MSTAASPGHLTAPGTWALRLAGLAALVNGASFGAFDIPAIWHLARDHTVWYAFGNPTYGNGPFEAHGITVTIPVLLAFLGSCLVLAIGGPSFSCLVRPESSSPWRGADTPDP